MDNLDRYESLEFKVFGQINPGHSTLTDDFEYAVILGEYPLFDYHLGTFRNMELQVRLAEIRSTYNEYTDITKEISQTPTPTTNPSTTVTFPVHNQAIS